MKIKLLCLIATVGCVTQASDSTSVQSIKPVSLEEKQRLEAKIDSLTQQCQKSAQKLRAQGVTDFKSVSVQSLMAGDTLAGMQKKRIERELCRMKLQQQELKTQKEINLWESILDNSQHACEQESILQSLFISYEALPENVESVTLETKIQQARKNRAHALLCMLREMKKLKATLRQDQVYQDVAQ